MNKKKLIQPKRKGFVALVMLAIVILLTVGVGLLGLGMGSRILAIRNASSAAARCAADAGLTKAVFEMNEKLKIKPWDDSTLPEATDETLPGFDATFSYTVTGDSINGYAVESTGKSLEAEKKVSCTLALISPFDSAIFVKENLILKPGTLVDGYNSLDPEDTDVDLHIGTNDTADDSIVLGSGVTVDGDVLVGFGGDVNSVIQDQGATTGDRYAITSDAIFPEVTVPTLFDMGGEIKVHGSTVTMSPADSGEYDGIELKQAANPAILEIDGGEVVLYITEDIDLGNECEIVVKEGASLVIYLDGNLIAGNNSGINNLNDPENFQLYGTGEAQAIDLKSKGDFYGVVYAPNADTTIHSTGDIYGSFISSNFELKSGGNFYYDEALRNTNINDAVTRFVVINWSE